MAREIKWKYEIGDRIIDYKDDGSLKRDLTIIDKEIRQREVFDKRRNKFILRNEKHYKYHCNICNWENGLIEEYNLNKGGCACCRGLVVVKGINDLATVYPELIKYFDNTEDAYKISKGSSKKVKLKCPTCGKLKPMVLSNLVLQGFVCDYCNSLGVKHPELLSYIKNPEDAFNIYAYSHKKIECKCIICGKEDNRRVDHLSMHGFKCNNCSDYVKYPEKFMSSLLYQLNVEYIKQLSNKTFMWCDGHLYDFYIPKFNMIIETHGKQHYEDGGFWYRTLAEEQENDRIKEEKAIANGIENYIVIDCRYSNMEWIQESIFDSNLLSILHIKDINSINWEQCNIDAIYSNELKDMCDYWNHHKNITTTQIAKVFNTSRERVLRYLTNGAELGLCNYDGHQERVKTTRKNGHSSGKVIDVFKDDEYLFSYKSMRNLEIHSVELLGVQLYASCISRVCRGKQKQYKGFVFKYSNNTDNIIDLFEMEE